MTTYTAIPNSDVDADSPVTTELMIKLRDNPIALAEGAAGAPKVRKAALQVSDGIHVQEDHDTTPAANSGVSEGALWSYSLPANTLGTARALRVSAFGNLEDGDAGTHTVRVKIGGTTVATFDGIRHEGGGPSGKERNWFLRGCIFAAGATNAQRSMFEMLVSEFFASGARPKTGAAWQPAGETGDTGAQPHMLAQHESIAEDSTGALTVQITHQGSTAGGSPLARVQNVLLELI